MATHNPADNVSSCDDEPGRDVMGTDVPGLTHSGRHRVGPP